MSVVDNRSQLLALAARCRDRFQLPLPHTPGAFAYGAMADPKDFGIDGPGAGTGGRGLTLQHAFESCMGETAEYLSFLRHQDDPLVQAGDADGSEWLDAVISTPGPGGQHGCWRRRNTTASDYVWFFGSGRTRCNRPMVARRLRGQPRRHPRSGKFGGPHSR